MSNVIDFQRFKEKKKKEHELEYMYTMSFVSDREDIRWITDFVMMESHNIESWKFGFEEENSYTLTITFTEE
jgi:hypothetical protein